jgi:predicted phosphate transport protein (TIGR00153 family)
MFRLSKKPDPFFSAFAAHARITVQASQLLRQLFERPGEVEDLKQKITLAEHEGDEITRATVTRLRSQWITPLDRPDIHTLTTRLDDVLDVIESIAERMLLFDIRESSAVAVDAACVLETSVAVMSKAIDLLPEARRRAPEILALCVEISGLESEADALYRTAIAELFKSGKDPLFVMKWRDIHEELEAATDLCEDVANALEGVVLEYA